MALANRALQQLPRAQALASHVALRARLPRDQAREQQAAVKQNTMVAGNLGIAINSASLILKIEKMKTAEWPNNLAFEIIEMLNKKFRPNDLLVLGEQKTKLLGIKLEPDQDPEELADAIAELEIEYRKDISEEDRALVLWCVLVGFTRPTARPSTTTFAQLTRVART